MFGALYQPRLDEWLEHAEHLDCLEVQVEHFHKTTPHRLRWLGAERPLIARCESLSLGGPDPVDSSSLDACAAVVHEANALWLTHPLGFSRAGEIDLGITVPIPSTRPHLQRVSDRIRRVADRCERPVLIENSSLSLRMSGALTESEFLNELCRHSGCRLAVNLGALYDTPQRDPITPERWLSEIDPQLIAQLRIVLWQVGGPVTGPSLDDQLALLSHQLKNGDPRAIVLAVPPRGPIDEIDRAWSGLTTASANRTKSGAVLG